MPGFNESLDRSLKLLYIYSLHFRVSIELIQKLAQYLKLDTFIDTEVQPNSSTSAKNLQRLSIAGSLLLVDLDFDGDRNPIKVSLSSGNHSPDESNTSDHPADPYSEAGKYVTVVNELEQLSTVKIDFSGGNTSFLNVKHENGQSVAEHILLSNLTGGTLGKFPANLMYLANLDSLSLPDGDLVVYMDNLALYLNAIHSIEAKLNPDNWQIEAGWGGRFGKVTLNDIESGRLGVLLQFWKEGRYLDRKLESLGETGSGKVHKAVLSIEESVEPTIDYVKNATNEVWKLSTESGDWKNYKFDFDGDLHLHNGQSVTSLTSRNWALVLNLSTEVYIPNTIIEYLGLSGLGLAKDATSEAYEQLGENGSLEYELSLHNTNVSFVTNEVYQYYAVNTVRLSSLGQLTRVIPLIRNQITLTTLIRNVAQTSGASLRDANAVSADVNKKLKDSLKLSNEVTDEELVGLNAMSEATDFMGVPMLESDTDLAEFVKEEADSETDRAETLETEGTKLKIVLKDIAYDSPDFDLQLSVVGSVKSKSFAGDFVIRNGAIVEVSTSGDVDMDADNASGRDFIKALGLSENVLLALDVII